MTRKTPYSANGKNYEIVVEEAAQGIKVTPMLNGKPLRVTYSVDFEIAADFQHYRGTSAVEELVKIVKGDLDAGIVK
jgi:hypothetical protein